VGRFFGAQEDLGVWCVLSAFTGDAMAVARTAIDDMPESTQIRIVCMILFVRCCLPTFRLERLQIGDGYVRNFSGQTISLPVGRRRYTSMICCVQFLF
jgi:hypothetical protein